MTATLTDLCPFPMPGQPLDNHAQAEALPVGSVIGYLGDDSEDTYTKADTDSWTDRDEVTSTTADFTIPDSGEGEFGVISIPSLSADELAQLPVGSVVWRFGGTGTDGAYTKYQEAPGNDPWQSCWHFGEQTGRYNSHIAPCYLISRGQQEPVMQLVAFRVGERCDDSFPSLPVGTRIVYLNEQLPCTSYRKIGNNVWHHIGNSGSENNHPYGDHQFREYDHWRIIELPGADNDEPVSIPFAAVTAGMYLQNPANADLRHFVLDVTGYAWHCIDIEGDTVQVCPPDNRRDGAAYAEYRVIPHDATLLKALAELATARPVVDEAELIRQGRVERDQWWREQMERFNEAAQQLAVDKSYCSDYDEFVQDWEHLGLTPRVTEQDYDVRIQITGYVDTRVTMSEGADDSDIYRVAREEIGIRDGDTYTVNGEAFNVTDVSDEKIEVA